MAPEVGKEFCVLVEPEELTDDLDGNDFRVAERGSWSACSEAPELSDTVINEAEDGHDEGAKIHKREDLRHVGCYWLNTERTRRSSVLLKSSKKLAHGVS